VKKSLAGDEINESKSSQLPLLRKNVAKRVLEEDKLYHSENNKMSSLRQSEVVEKRKTGRSLGKNTALLMSRMHLSFLKVLNPLSPSLSFSLFSEPVEDEAIEIKRVEGQ
jgi:hypothetical protein